MKRKRPLRPKKIGRKKYCGSSMVNNNLLKQPIIQGVKSMDIMTNDVHPDDEYLKDTLKELGIDLNKPKHRSHMPKNKFGITVIRGAAGKDMVTMYREEKGRC